MTNCCGINVNICRRCKNPYCKHYKSVYSFRMCCDCVEEVVEKWETENLKGDTNEM
jgi:hypothetical protein